MAYAAIPLYWQGVAQLRHGVGHQKGCCCQATARLLSIVTELASTFSKRIQGSFQAGKMSYRRCTPMFDAAHRIVAAYNADS